MTAKEKPIKAAYYVPVCDEPHYKYVCDKCGFDGDPISRRQRVFTKKVRRLLAAPNPPYAQFRKALERVQLSGVPARNEDEFDEGGEA